MGKAWSTKKRILQMLSSQRLNLTEISNRLGVAPCTVSQHLSELKGMGAIEEVENEHIKKWKYYRANPNFDADNFAKGGHEMKNVGWMAMGAVVVIAIAVGVILLTSGAGNSSVQYPGSNLIFSITDPPQVPAGTTSLMISYSSLQAHVNGSSSWIDATGSGTLDLMQLVNVSQVIGNTVIPNNSTVDMLRFTINSANITVNGTTYNVTVPSSTVTAKVFSSMAVNGSSEALMDATPTVAVIYTGNSTIFVMVPSVKAVIVPQSNQFEIGHRRQLNETERGELNGTIMRNFSGIGMRPSEQPNFTVSAESLSTYGNYTSLSITLSNSGNVPVRIQHVSLFGNFSVAAVVGPQNEGGPMHQLPPNVGISDISNANDNSMMNVNGNESNGSDNGPMPPPNYGNNSNGMGEADMHSGPIGIYIRGPVNATSVTNAAREHNVEIEINGNTMMNRTFNSTLANAVGMGIHFKTMRMLTFLVPSNGTLMLPFSENDFMHNGYTLAPNSSVILSFNGIVTLGEGHMKISPIMGDSYRIVVQGDDGAQEGVSVIAFSSLQSAQGGSVAGKVDIGPWCPVENASNSSQCATPAGTYTSRELVLTGPQGNALYIGLDSDGSFSASVPIGTYSVGLTNCTFLGCSALNQSVTVLSGTQTSFNVSIDTGIR